MGVLDWIKNRGRTREPEPEPEHEPAMPFGATKRGNPIDLVRSEEWQSDPVGVHETRMHIGRSVEGFHGGFQAVPAGGDGGIQWSNARSTEERAALAAQGMSGRWDRENAQAFLDFENNSIREFERKNSGQREVPGLEESPKPSRTHSIFGDYPDRVLKTEADVKKDDALLDMTLVVHEMANDPDTNWNKYKGDFEKAVSGMREAFAPEIRHQRAERSAPSGAEKQRSDAQRQQDHGGWTQER